MTAKQLIRELFTHDYSDREIASRLNHYGYRSCVYNRIRQYTQRHVRHLITKMKLVNRGSKQKRKGVNRFAKPLFVTYRKRSELKVYQVFDIEESKLTRHVEQLLFYTRLKNTYFDNLVPSQVLYLSTIEELSECDL